MPIIDDIRFSTPQPSLEPQQVHLVDKKTLLKRFGKGSKGTGKDYIAGAHGNIELAGPSQLL